jgi:translation initiation factor IF-1
VLPSARFKVKLNDNEVEVLAYLSGKMRKHNIMVILGDDVELEFSPYDLTLGRVIRRKNKEKDLAIGDD